jgi:hypothetical protein
MAGQVRTAIRPERIIPESVEIGMRYRFILLCVGMTAALLGACASGEPVQQSPRLDMAEVREMLDCPMVTTPVCTERIGQPYYCFCADKDALRRIMEPDKY